MAFDLANYSTVAERIELFVLEHPNFRIDSQVWDIIIEGAAYVRVKFSVYKDAPDYYLNPHICRAIDNNIPDLRVNSKIRVL